MISMPNVMAGLSNTPGSMRRPAPDTVGQPMEEALAEVLVRGAAARDQLRHAGVI